MPDNPFAIEQERRQANPFAAEQARRGFVPALGVEANQALQMSGPGQTLPPRPPPTPTEQIEQVILTARMRQGRPRQARAPSELETNRRIRLAANAGLAGFGPDIGAQMADFRLDLTDDEVDQIEQLMRQEIQLGREQQPGESLAAELAAGGAALGGVGGSFIGGAKTLPQAAGRSGLIGSGVGAVMGAGEAGGDLANRAQGALGGAALGGVLGVAAPVAVAGGARGLRGIVNRIRPGSTQRNAADRILNALNDEQITVDQARQRLDKLGVQATVADVADETRRLARGVASEPGPASAQATRVLQGRQDAQGQRILQSVEDQLPIQESFQGTVDDLITSRANAARPLYQRAYAEGVPFTDELQELFNRPAVKQAWQRAQQIAGNEGITLPEVFVTDAAGNLTLQTQTAPNMPTIDFIKRGLDDIVEQARDPITRKIVGDSARSVANVRGELLSIVDEINPTYATARAAFAGPSGSLDALNLGRRFARGDPEILTKQLDRLTPNDQAFFRAGVAEGLRDLVLRTPDGVNAARRLAGNELMRERLRSVFPDEESANEFIRQMLNEGEMFRTRQTVLGGSPTARIQAEQSALAGPAADVALDVATGTPGVGALRGVARSIMGGGGRPDPALTAELGRQLFSQGDDLQNVLQQLQARQGQQQGGAELQALITALGAIGGGQRAGQ
ncbi:MAG: hypothetical protein ABUJ98_12695 [Hyphomicrobium sp.]